MPVKFASLIPDNPLELSIAQTSSNQKAHNRYCNGESPLKCENTLYMGFFFDGTNNNLFRDEEGKTHSNVARLFKLFPRRNEKGFARTYIPGVGTAFPAIGDPGCKKGHTNGQSSGGLAMALHGEARILHALMQAHNHVHTYYSFPTPLTTVDQELKLIRTIVPAEGTYKEKDGMIAAIGKSAIHYSSRLKSTIMRRKLLDARNKLLIAEVKPAQKLKNQPSLTKIVVSIFGFSRGSAEARVFANWFLDMIEPEGYTLAGIPVEIQFMGIFDTVASVGIANSIYGCHGHFGWAEPQEMRIPKSVTRCLHLVSAHEVRGSFPLDSICQGDALPANCEEIMYPGVHSDLGGGYKPGEQGRGEQKDGSDKMSQITLAHMYREAVSAGVPLPMRTKTNFALRRDGTDPSDPKGDKCGDDFKIDPAVIQSLNGYLNAAGGPKAGSVRALSRYHYGQFLRWRHAHLKDFDKLSNVPRMALQDRTDMLNANEELKKEEVIIESLTYPVVGRPLKIASDELAGVIAVVGGAGYGAKEGYKAGHDAVAKNIPEYLRFTPIVGSSLTQPPGLVGAGVGAFVGTIAGFKGAQIYRDGVEKKIKMWPEVKPYWSQAAPPAAVSHFFQNYVHDSHAWFKPFADDDAEYERTMKDKYKHWAALDEKEKHPPSLHSVLDRPSFPAPQVATEANAVRATDQRLTPDERRELQQFQKTGQIPPQTSGREPYLLGLGYLRFRTIYTGGIKDEDLARDYDQKIKRLDDVRFENEMTKLPAAAQTRETKAAMNMPLTTEQNRDLRANYD